MELLNEFKLGTNFDMDVLESIINLNGISQNGKVTEMYGSDRAHSKLAARPGFRLPDVSKEHIEEYVKHAKEAGINFNYTANSIIPMGSKAEIVNHLSFIVDFVGWLESIGVYRITVANPMMLEIIRNIAHSDIEIEASTIMHIDTITQIKYLYEKYGVRKICANLNKTRDFEWLEKAAEYCNKNGIILELMANEFCGVGGDNYATHCVYRDSCYICHATNESLEDTMTLNEYPMKFCTNSRNQNPANWLRLRFIRPEDIKVYNEIGINHFKITGRTGTTAYIVRTISAYLNQNYVGNLLNLWKPLESIGHDDLENDTVWNIPNKSLDGFIDFWSKYKHNCDNQVCGETCTYCEEWYNRYCKED